MEMTNTILRAIDKGKIVTGIFMDLTKAFDLVDHKILLRVLEKYGIRGIALNILKSYLENRSQVVKINATLSKPSPIRMGVVQGSCLGPLLFLIFINAIGSLNVN